MGFARETPGDDVLNRKGVLLAVTTVVVALLVTAWIDGGREQVHEISQDLPLPGGAK